MITLAKSDKTDNKLKVFDHVQRPAVGSKLITSIAERYKDRHGGYTRVWNLGLRPSDKAPIALIELVDNPDDLRKSLDKLQIESKNK